MRADPIAEAAGVRKAPRHEVAVGGALAGSDHYGDCVLASPSMEVMALARVGVGVRCAAPSSLSDLASSKFLSL